MREKTARLMERREGSVVREISENQDGTGRKGMKADPFNCQFSLPFFGISAAGTEQAHSSGKNPYHPLSFISNRKFYDVQRMGFALSDWTLENRNREGKELVEIWRGKERGKKGKCMEIAREHKSDNIDNRKWQ